MATRIWSYGDEAARTIDVNGFDVFAQDEQVGRVHSATDEVDVTYIVVDAALQRVLLPAGLVTEVDPERRRIVLSCTTAEVHGAPRFDEQRELAATQRIEAAASPDPEPAQAAEPTKDELYAEATRLGVRGRSGLAKSELVDEIERVQTEKATPIQVQAFLDGLDYPADTGDLLSEAEKHRATAEVRATLERLPNRRFEDPTDVSRAIGELP